MNKTGKTLLGCGCGCLVVVAIGAALTIGGGYWAFKNMIQTDPVAVAKTADDIATFTAPEDFKPVMAMDMSLMKVPMKFVVYSEEGSTGVLMLGEFTGDLGQQTPEQMAEAMKQQMNQQKGGKQGAQETIESRVETIAVRGKPSNFTFAKVRNSQTKEEAWELIGAFPPKAGKQGTDIVILMLPTKDWEEADLKDFVESIK